MCEILKSTAHQRGNSFTFRKLLLLALTSTNSKGSYAIALMRKKSISTIFKIMNINVDFRIFVNASHSIFLKKHENTNKTKTKHFLENRGHSFVDNDMILTCAKIQRKILLFGEVGALESSS